MELSVEFFINIKNEMKVEYLSGRGKMWNVKKRVSNLTV